MTRDEADKLSTWPEGYSCANCDSTAIKCFGEVDREEVRFGCIDCSHIWSEEIEEDEDYLAEQERRNRNKERLHDVTKMAEQGVIDRETIAKIDFSQFSVNYVDFDLVDTLADMQEWDLIDTIMDSVNERERRNTLTSGHVAKCACQRLDGLQRYADLLEKHIERAPFLYWFISEKFFKVESYGDTSRFIDLIIRLWQHHMKAGRNRFFEVKEADHSDKRHFLLFKERFWDEMSDAQRAALTHIEKTATEYG